MSVNRHQRGKKYRDPQERRTNVARILRSMVPPPPFPSNWVSEPVLLFTSLSAAVC